MPLLTDHSFRGSGLLPGCRGVLTVSQKLNSSSSELVDPEGGIEGPGSPIPSQSDSERSISQQDLIKSLSPTWGRSSMKKRAIWDSDYRNWISFSCHMSLDFTLLFPLSALSSICSMGSSSPCKSKLSKFMTNLSFSDLTTNRSFSIVNEYGAINEFRRNRRST